jgi:ribosome biogenesis GTPase A
MLFRSSFADQRSNLFRRCLLCFSTSLSATSSSKHIKEHTEASEQPRPGSKGQQQQQQQRRLIVAVVGLPNAGKSTLTNRLIGHKISGVSSKRNTTIDPQLGSFAFGSSQVCCRWQQQQQQQQQSVVCPNTKLVTPVL